MMLSNGNLLACSGLCLYVTTSDRVDKKRTNLIMLNPIYFIDSKDPVYVKTLYILLTRRSLIVTTLPTIKKHICNNF